MSELIMKVSDKVLRPTKEITSIPIETKKLSGSKTISKERAYENIDGKRFLVTKSKFIDEKTQVQQVRRDNSRFIAEITKNHQDGHVVSQTVKVRELDSATKNYFLTAQYKTEYTYDSENNKDTTHSNSKFYGRDGKVTSIQDLSVRYGEIIYDATMKYDSNGHAYISRFLNSDGKYEKSGANSTISDIGQLADATSSCLIKKSTPTPTNKAGYDQLTQQLQRIVPDNRFPI
ncbi:TPA: hypothetical protein ACQ31I_003552 [Yersinia enterocolitica]